VLIVDDRDGSRSMLRDALDAAGHVCAEAARGSEAAALAVDAAVDVVVLGLSASDAEVCAVARRIKKSRPLAEILVLSVEVFPRTAHDVLSAGALGCVLWSDPERDLLLAVAALRDHKPYFSSTVAEIVLSKPAAGDVTPSEVVVLPTRRILIVDDDRDCAQTMTLMLGKMGNAVRAAYDGIEALDAAAAFRPDVVLLDLTLPKLDGCGAARRMRAEPWGKSILLVAMTGWARDEDRQRSREAGFDHHLVKPVDLGDIEEILQQRAAASVGASP
jgi:CheY-like chemotaxis protein